jgi:broad specificity phosphatase PhoE
MTAEIISKKNGNIPIIIKEYINEWEVGERTKDIEKRMSMVLKDAGENVLFISHRDPILVFLNKFFPRDAGYSEQDCPPACLYELKYNKVKKAEAIFQPR